MRKILQILFGLIRLFQEKLWNGRRLKLHGYKYCFCSGAHLYTNRNDNSFLDLGTKTWISQNCSFSASGGNITIGFNNFFNTNVKIIAKSGITIGDNNLFGPNVVIVDHDHRFDDRTKLICKQGFTSAPIVIGSDIWIGANSLICQGVTICDHVVVAGNSVVTKPITEPGVYGGVPAKKIKDI